MCNFTLLDRFEIAEVSSSICEEYVIDITAVYTKVQVLQLLAIFSSNVVLINFIPSVWVWASTDFTISYILYHCFIGKLHL